MRKSKDADRAYQRQYMAETRRWWREHHCCSGCGKQDAYTIAGRGYCFECNQKRKNTLSRELRDKRNAAARNKRADRKVAGLCTVCGSNLPTGYYQFVTCPSCRRKAQIRSEKKRREQGIVPRNMYKSLGICYLCGNPVSNQTTAYGGNPLRLCDSCYEKTKIAAKKGRESYLEKYGKTWGQFEYQYERGREKAQSTEIRRSFYSTENG